MFHLRGFTHQDIAEDYKSGRLEEEFKYPTKSEISDNISRNALGYFQDHLGTSHIIGITGINRAIECIHCGTALKEGEMLGIPIQKLDNVWVIDNDNLCSFECMLSRYYSKSQSSLYSNSLPLIYQMFDKYYPNSNLIRAPEREEYIKYGGFRDRSDFPKHVYYPTINFTLSTINREFHRF